ncbi:MAG: hypothetical protein JJU46_05150 [Balneolaceae bacterium]|nr:hypothetical protein [Balneolaceae bacterium]
MALLIPSGLHAKQLVDFCKTEFGSMPGHTTEIPMNEMEADHSCCEDDDSEDPASDAHSHHDCDWGFICACGIGESALSDADWTISTTDSAIQLAEKGDLTPYITTSERISISQNKQLAQHDPPLWLVYDTFLT